MEQENQCGFDFESNKCKKGIKIGTEFCLKGKKDCKFSKITKKKGIYG